VAYRSCRDADQVQPRAAEAGDGDAQRNLGALLAYWVDPREIAQARKWLTSAAEAGDSESVRMLEKLSNS
jgi:TPR repeat protein